MVQSMGRVGYALDNAAAEAVNNSLKVEYVHHHRFRTRAEVRLKVTTWIADFCNTNRRHSADNGLAPITFERYMIEKRTASLALPRTAVAWNRSHASRGLAASVSSQDAMATIEAMTAIAPWSVLGNQPAITEGRKPPGGPMRPPGNEPDVQAIKKTTHSQVDEGRAGGTRTRDPGIMSPNRSDIRSSI
ncbi:hypothetical protein GCM10010517_30880 [Streptosporangium fragile]|uniref:Integrase catalytic domain-containing protein n=1 Tax=Streptosporangium fragile TaxID=46186 RepID=A0ABN3VZN1_9ACTN